MSDFHLITDMSLILSLFPSVLPQPAFFTRYDSAQDMLTVISRQERSRKTRARGFRAASSTLFPSCEGN